MFPNTSHPVAHSNTRSNQSIMRRTRPDTSPRRNEFCISLASIYRKARNRKPFLNNGHAKLRKMSRTFPLSSFYCDFGAGIDQNYASTDMPCFRMQDASYCPLLRLDRSTLLGRAPESSGEHAMYRRHHLPSSDGDLSSLTRFAVGIAICNFFSAGLPSI